MRLNHQLYLDGRVLESNHKFRGIGKFAKDLFRVIKENIKSETFVLMAEKRNFSKEKFPKNFKFVKYVDKNFFHLKWLFENAYLNEFVPEDAIYFNPFLEMPSRNKRAIIFCHDVVPIIFSARYKKAEVIKFRYKFAWATRAKQLVTISQSSKKEILGLEPQLKNIISIVHPFVDSDFKERKPQKRENFFIYPASFVQDDFRKNFNFAIDFWVEVIKKYPNLKLYLIGKTGKFSEKLHKKIIKKNLQKNIIFTGFISQKELISFYTKARGLFFPSRYEGFGIPPLEALAYNCPVVAANVSSIPEVVGKAAILVKPDSKNYSPWLEAIKKIMDGNYKFPAKEARKSLNKFSKDNTLKELEAVFKKADQ